MSSDLIVMSVGVFNYRILIEGFLNGRRRLLEPEHTDVLFFKQYVLGF